MTLTAVHTESDSQSDYLDEIADHVELQLNRILNSPLFNAASQKQQFLGFVVRKTLAGQSHKLKQYTIAVEGLGFPVSFDSDQNPLIRVVAGRVRQKLNQYYATLGLKDALIINIPKGSYIPDFSYRDNVAEHPASLQQSKTGIREQNKRIPNQNGKTVFTRSEGPKLGLVGLQDNNLPDENNALLRHITDNLARELGHFIFSRLQVAMPYPEMADFDQAVAKLNNEQPLDYLLAIHLQQGTVQQLTCRLLYAPSQELIWTDTFDLELKSSNEQLSAVYGRITTTVMDLQQGMMHVDWSRRLLLQPQTIATVHQVLAFYRQHTDKFSNQTFGDAVQACETALELNPDDLIANVVYADYCRREHVYDYGVIKEPLASGKLAAEKAIRLKPDSHEAHYVLGQILYNLGQSSLSKYEFEQAREISKHHALVTFGTGYHLCIMNEWDKGMPLVEEAMTVSPSYPDWYNLAPFLNEYRQKHYEQALQHACLIITPGIYWGPLARAVCYGQLGKTDKAKNEIQELLRRFPDFGKRGIKYQKRFLGYEELTQHVWEGLLKAGITEFLKPRE